MYYADTLSAETILARIQQLASDDERLAPAETLQRLARDGGRFIDL